MSVYVDDMEAPFGRYIMCHMWADTYDELRQMVLAIGVDFKWLQHPPRASWVHMDIVKTKRALAVQHGAIEKRWREAILWKNAQPFNATYRKFYEEHWRWSRDKYDYETGTLYRKPYDPDDTDADIPF